MKSSEFFRNKVVLITGASMGIGKALALQVLNYGGKVAITGRNEARLLAIKSEFQEHSENLLIHSGDVANYEDAVSIIDKVVLRFGRLDVLINNAGMSNNFADLEITNKTVVDEIINTNVKGSVYNSMVAIPELKKTKGSLLFVSSIAALRGLPGYSMYSLSKMALTALSQSIRIENKKAGVFVGIAYIGFTENEEKKRTLSNDGKPEKVPGRSKLVTRSRSQTAKIILHQIAYKKPRVVHSFIGKLTYILCKYTPALANIMYKRIYNNQKKTN